MSEFHGIYEIAQAINRFAKTIQLIHASNLEASINEDYFPEKTGALLQKFLVDCVTINNSG